VPQPGERSSASPCGRTTSSVSDRRPDPGLLNLVVAPPITTQMSVHIQPLSTLPQLRGLLEVTRLVRDERDLTKLCDAIAATIADSINLYRPIEGDFIVTTVHGSDAARDLLLGGTQPVDAWDPHFVDRYLRRGAYLLANGEGDWEGVTFHVPELEPSSDPNAWHPEDALMVPMRGADGTLLGVISVDEPESGLRPTDEELDVLVAFAEHVIGAIETAKDADTAARDRTSLTQLLDVSASLIELDSADEVVRAVARGIEQALEFEKVAVCLAHDGRFSPSGTAGWEANDPGLDFVLTDADMDKLLVPEFEIEGCYLLEDTVATALVGDCSNYESQRSGAGPRAWTNHWLLVPLIERDGSRNGFIWADDPSDSMLPSRERLQALRTFANQATMALRAAVDFETVTRRNTELAALHETTVALLAGIEVDSVLDAILSNAAALLSAPYGFLYLPSESGEELELRAHRGFEAFLAPQNVGRGQGVAGQVLETGEAVLVEDYPAWINRLPHFAGAPFTSVLAVPLRGRGELSGVLGIAMDGHGKLGTAELALLERFAHLASLALENARLYTEAQRQLAERSLLNEKLRQAQKMESIGRLAGGIAHDFNNLLTAISGYAELMLMDFDAHAVPTRDSAEQIVRAAGRAASLTGQLLAFSRKQVLRPQVIDLNEVVGRMAAMLARMLGEDVVLSTALDSELGATLADPTQIEQVVLNLALNARDAMPAGGNLVIRTAPFELGEHDDRPHPDLEPGSYVTLAVCDTGIGMEPELIETIFEPFFTTKAVGEGTGLGLATVHGIVSQSGGVIYVESAPGEGTTFTVCLPRVAS
jgi:signal transduction histidine kinase